MYIILWEKEYQTVVYCVSIELDALQQHVVVVQVACTKCIMIRYYYELVYLVFVAVLHLVILESDNQASYFPNITNMSFTLNPPLRRFSLPLTGIYGTRCTRLPDRTVVALSLRPRAPPRPASDSASAAKDAFSPALRNQPATRLLL
jgi:hypothetical protein